MTEILYCCLFYEIASRGEREKNCGMERTACLPKNLCLIYPSISLIKSTDSSVGTIRAVTVTPWEAR